MLRLAVLFFVLALIAMALGATHMSGTAVEISRIFVMIFLFLAILTGIVGIFKGRGPPKHIS